MPSNARGLHIAQRVKGHQRVYIPVDAEHQCPVHVSSFDFHEMPHPLNQLIRIVIRMSGLKPAQELAPAL